MGTWEIVDHIRADQAGETADGFRVFAPSLRALPRHAPLAMATLPILDWNAELLAALTNICSMDGRGCYAAVMMIDPFTLWEDLADVLRERGFSGVVNFPPASLAEGTQTAGGPEEDSKLEIDRLKWFSETGFKLAYAATSTEQITRIEARLEALLDGILYMPASTLAKALDHTLPLEPYRLPRRPVENVWTLR